MGTPYNLMLYTKYKVLLSRIRYRPVLGEGEEGRKDRLKDGELGMEGMKN